MNKKSISNNSVSGPLAGIKVLDMSRILAGPTCTQLLGDYGADIIKVEKPGNGDDTRNWGPPFMLLAMGGAFAITRKYLFSNYQEPEIKESTIDTVFFLSKTCLALLLIGHAGFGFAVEKQMLINHWQSIGVDADVSFITNVGYGEFALGVLIFLAPVKPLIFIALLWKLFTEFLYVPADTVAGMGIVNIFEWIERWGDYGIPVVMLYILSYKQAKAVN